MEKGSKIDVTISDTVSYTRQSKAPNKPKRGKRVRPENKTEKPQKKRRLRRVLLVMLFVVLFLAAVIFTAYAFLVQKPQISEPDFAAMAQDERPIRLSGDRKEEFYTFLLVGQDTGGGGNTDTILLAAYDIPQQQLHVLSIPRDTLVNVPWDVKKINSVYPVKGGGQEGIDSLCHEVGQLLGFVPDFQIVMQWEAVGRLVDAIGGVTYDVPRRMYYDDPAQNLHIRVEKGEQLLDGEQAMGVVRFRSGAGGYADGDLGRIRTQQGFLKALFSQCLQIRNVTRLGELAEIFSENVQSNLTLANLSWFAQEAVLGGLQEENITFDTLPCTDASLYSETYRQNLSYVMPKAEELLALVNEKFNPYTRPLELFELDILTVQKDGTLVSSAGKVQKADANSAGSADAAKAETPQSRTESAERPYAQENAREDELLRQENHTENPDPREIYTNETKIDPESGLKYQEETYTPTEPTEWGGSESQTRPLLPTGEAALEPAQKVDDATWQQREETGKAREEAQRRQDSQPMEPAREEVHEIRPETTQTSGRDTTTAPPAGARAALGEGL